MGDLNCAKLCSANGPISHKIGFSKVHGCNTCDDEVKQKIYPLQNGTKIACAKAPPVNQGRCGGTNRQTFAICTKNA
jgi:hypothetical protein